MYLYKWSRAKQGYINLIHGGVAFSRAAEELHMNSIQYIRNPWLTIKTFNIPIFILQVLNSTDWLPHSG